MPGYEDRFFYLTMNETDLVTGRHLKKIPGAVEEICRGLEIRGKRPRVVMICITCVDALLGTDMDRICRRAREKVPGVRVQPCYMYALTREGRKPPMVHVRQSIYELLDPRRKKASSVNLLGFFAPLEGSAGMSETGNSAAQNSDTGSELFAILRQAGIRKIRQIGACRDYDAFQEMGEANFNIVLNPEVRPAAYDLQERLGIPFIEMSRFYQNDRIEAQYAALGNVLQTKFDDAVYKKEAVEAVEDFRRLWPDAVFSVGEAMNGNAGALPQTGELTQAVKRERYLHRFRMTIRSTFLSLVVVAAVAVLVAVLLLPILRIYGKSMNGTLDSGDIVVSVKGSGFETGDVIAFYYNNNILVKRVIANPGDWVDMDKDGNVYVNNTLIDEPYLNEKAYGETNIELPYQVPEGKVFVMGDNRSVSIDSRNTSIGCVSEEQIVGKIVFRVWPLAQMGAVH